MPVGHRRSRRLKPMRPQCAMNMARLAGAARRPLPRPWPARRAAVPASPGRDRAAWALTPSIGNLRTQSERHARWRARGLRVARASTQHGLSVPNVFLGRGRHDSGRRDGTRDRRPAGASGDHPPWDARRAGGIDVSCGPCGAVRGDSGGRHPARHSPGAQVAPSRGVMFHGKHRRALHQSRPARVVVQAAARDGRQGRWSTKGASGGTGAARGRVLRVDVSRETSLDRESEAPRKGSGALGVGPSEQPTARRGRRRVPSI